MNITRMVCATMLGFCLCGPGLYAADSAAGQKIFEDACASCHRLADYAGKSHAGLEETLSGMVAGRIDHPKKLALSDTDVRNLAAYISSSREAR